MGYKVKLQKVQRPTNKSFYISFPTTLADACEMEKGELLEWTVKDKNTFILKRIKES